MRTGRTLSALLAIALLLMTGCGSPTLENIVVSSPAGQGPFSMTFRGEAVPLTATGVYANNEVFDITNKVTWSSSNTSLVTVNTVGVVTATTQCTSPGTVVTITATKGTISGFINITANCTA